MCQNVIFWRILGQISGVTTIVNVSQCAQTHTVNYKHGQGFPEKDYLFFYKGDVLCDKNL